MTTPQNAKPQHTAPCRECPWRLKSLPGYTGPETPAEWIAMAHSDVKIPCHLARRFQCAGAGIYRANVCKRPRDPAILVFPRDPAVFSSHTSFLKHHARPL